MVEKYFINDKLLKLYLNADYRYKFYFGLFKHLGLDITQGSGLSSLDVGIALGHLSMMLDKFEWDVYGMDVSEYGIKYCSERIGKTDHFKVGDAVENIPFNRTFDLVTLFGLLGYGPDMVKDRDRLLRNCMAATKPGGIFVASAPNGHRPSFVRKFLTHGKDPYGILTPSEWKKYLLSIGWKSVEIKTIQRIPILSSKYSYHFINFKWGEPLVMKCIR